MTVQLNWKNPKEELPKEKKMVARLAFCLRWQALNIQLKHGFLILVFILLTVSLCRKTILKHGITAQRIFKVNSDLMLK